MVVGNANNWDGEPVTVVIAAGLVTINGSTIAITSATNARAFSAGGTYGSTFDAKPVMFNSLTIAIASATNARAFSGDGGLYMDIP